MVLRLWAAAACLLCLLCLSGATPAMPPRHRIADKELILDGVSPDCPVIYDNDWWTDVPDAAYLWAKASLGQCKLKGNIITRCTFGWEKGYAHKLEEQLQDCRKLLEAARASGLRNIPDPVLGAKEALQRPKSGKMEDTRFERSQGSDLLVAEALKASPEKPLLVFVGGSCTTVATAYLSEPAIAERMIVFQIDGGAYNGSDGWSWEIALKKCYFANWARGYFWDKLSAWNPAPFQRLPNNPLGSLLQKYAASGLAKANQWGDGAWIYYLFDRRCLTKVEDYDRLAITVPKDATDANRIAAEFIATMSNTAVYRSAEGGLAGYEMLVASFRTGDTEIFVIDPDSGDARNLTRSPKSEERYPSWSPDGKWVAFNSDRDGTHNLYIIGVDGKHLRQLTREKRGVEAGMQSWTADGKWIYFGLFGKGEPRMCRIAPDGTNFTGVGKGIDPAVSPDGKSIAFAKNLADGHHLYIMDADGSNVRQLTSKGNRFGGVHAAWPPDGKWIVYADQVGEALEIFRIQPDGKNAVQLTRLGKACTTPAVSPDGKWISFRYCDEIYWRDGKTSERAYRERRADKRPVWVMGMDGSNPHVIEALHYQTTIDGSRAPWRPR
jgi:TolB protein